MDQYLAGLESDARQPRLTMVVDEQANTKTHERTEGVATAVQSIYEDSCFTTRADPDPMCSTTLDDDCIQPPAHPCSGGNALIGNGAVAPKSCLPSLKMRSPTATGGIIPTGEASIATRTTLNQPPFRLY